MKKKKNRKRKRVHQQRTVTLGFVVHAQYGSIAQKMMDLGLPVTIPIDERGVLGCRKAAEQVKKKAEREFDKIVAGPPWNFPKGEKWGDRKIIVTEKIKKTSKLQGSKYGKSFTSGK